MTSRCLILIIQFLLISCSSTSALGAGGVLKDSVTREDALRTLNLLLEWLPGDYTSESYLKSIGPLLPGDKRGDLDDQNLMTHIRAVDMPAVGENVLFVEEYRGVNRSRLERVRLYSLWFDSDSGQTKMLVINPIEPESLIGARNKLSQVEALKAEELAIDSNGCILSFARRGKNIVSGRMVYRGCTFGNLWVDYELHVSQDSHWVCYSRRLLVDDFVSWQLINGLPCVLMSKI